jgi:copper chaperone NosL
MNSIKIKSWMRVLIALCGVALLLVLYYPMWRIDLDAPQYPEGLNLLIYANKLGGNVEIINGLNHYIGMKTLHTEDFFEFKILPYLILFFSIGFLLVAVIGRRKWMNWLFILFILFGVTAMVDFWKWEYNYGHNLNPDAAIIVPGMSYQPPLIGFKQLLNFGAYSVPDIGGWIFIGAGLALLICVVVSFRQSK